MQAWKLEVGQKRAERDESARAGASPVADAQAPVLVPRAKSEDELPREERVRVLTERVAGLLGLANVNVRVNGDLKTGCRLTSSGIDFMVNPVASEVVSLREESGAEIDRDQISRGIVDRRRKGVKGSLSLRESDMMAAIQLSCLARDFLDPGYGPVPFPQGALPESSRRFLTASIDDMAADAAMLGIPYARRRYEAWISRKELHFMQALPLQKQLVKTLKLYMFEDRPFVMAKPVIVRKLGTVDHMNPLVGKVRAVLRDPAVGYQERHRLCHALFLDIFASMEKRDEAGFSYYEAAHLFDDEESYAPSREAADDDLFQLNELDAMERANESLKTVTEENIDQLISDTGERDMVSDAAPSLRLPGMRNEEGRLWYARGEEGAYEKTVRAGSREIEEVAELFCRIAHPAEELSLPRYDPRPSTRGVRLNPRTLADAQVQLATEVDRPIWQRCRPIVRQQDERFDGLDVYMLVDVSYSMRGERARYAATTAVYLLEGLERASGESLAAYGGTDVDIRSQLMAFGDGWAPVTPLSTVQTAADKETCYHAIANPESDQTIVGGALRFVGERAREEPDRSVLVLVVSDGLFADNLRARKQALQMPPNVYLGHVNIGEYGGLPLSANYDSVPDPSQLPEKLKTVLQNLIDARE